MANNINVAITADVADLTAKRAILSAELKAAQKDLNDFAKTARTSGMTDELRAGMLKSAEALAKTQTQVRSVTNEIKNLGEKSGAAKAAFNVFDRSRLAVIEEAGAKIPIFGSALADIGPAGIAAAGGVAAVGFAVEKEMKTLEWAEELERASRTLGLTTTQLQEFDFIAQSVGIPIDKMRESMSGLEKTIGLVESNMARAMQTKAFTDMLKITPEQLRSWGDLNTQLGHILDKAAGMNAEERAALAQRLKVDPEVLQSLIDARGDLEGLKKTAHEYSIVLSDDTIAKQAEASRQMHQASAIIGGEFRTAFLDIAPVLVQVAHGVEVVSKGIADFIAGIKAGMPALQGFMALMRGDVVGAVSAVAHGGAQVRAQEDAANTAADKARQAAGPKPTQLSDATAKHGPSVVEKWSEQLHEMEIKSGEFFKDQTSTELAFWQGKLGLVKKNIKEWLEIQSKIYELQKTLAHQAYDDHLAGLNEQLEADRDNWAKEKADWNAKLDFIKAHFGQESKEYKDAYRQFEAAEREHQHQMAQIAREGAQEQLDELKANLETNRKIREADAREAESEIAERGRYGGVTGEVQAAQQIAALHRQIGAQELADLNTEYAARNTILEREIADAKAAYGEESAAYIQAIDAKKKADNDFANQHRALENQIVNQTRADAQKIQQAWHGIVDPMVRSTGEQFKGLIEGTETWGQALANIGEEALSLVVDAIERMVERWIVARITGAASEKATFASQLASQVALAGAGGVASMAAAPFPIDLGAPAFGAAMAQAAAAFGALGAFDKGVDLVPQDMIAQIHAGERIVPRADNERLMAAVAGSGGRGGGDTHINFTHAPSISGQAPVDVIRHLERNKRDFARLLKSMSRDGHFGAA